MANNVQFGCKKCGAVITVELQSSSDRFNVRVKDGRVHDSFGKTEIQCKKCGTTVATVSVNQS